MMGDGGWRWLRRFDCSGWDSEWWWPRIAPVDRKQGGLDSGTGLDGLDATRRGDGWLDGRLSFVSDETPEEF